MIYVYIKKELAKFDTDIRDLCLAFFTLQKIKYIIEDENVGAKLCEPATVGEKLCEPTVVGAMYWEPDIIVKDYYTGLLTGDRLIIKSELKRQLYNYLSRLTGKTLLWGTLTGIRPVNIVTKMIEDGIVGSTTNIVGAKFCDSVPVGAKHCELAPVTASSATGITDSEIKSELKKEYYISDLKAKELIKIAKKEIEILNRKEVKEYRNSYSIYVGVPFCKSTCLYCSFTSYNIDKFSKYVDSYLESLDKDFKTRINNILNTNANLVVRGDGEGVNTSIVGAKHCEFETIGAKLCEFETVGAKLCEPAPVGVKHCEPSHIGELNDPQKLTPLTLYIGGGTPTSLSEEQFDKLLSIIDKYIDKSKCIEYTVEAGRPDTITKEKLLIMKKHGVTRISINPQSFNQKTLDLIGRKHTVKDVIDKFKLARNMGFDNINMDIILGLPNEHLFQALKTLNGIRKLKPDSFTVHSLALKRAARLNFELDSWTKNYYLAGLVNSDLIVRGDSVVAKHCEPAPAVAKLCDSAPVGAKLYESATVGAKLCEPEGNREIDKMFKWSERLAKFLHLEQYYLYRQKNMAGNLENVGYAKEGKECIYNIMMMSERHSVYGFGTATTKEVFYESDGSKRIESEEGYKSVIDYCKSFNL